MKWRASRSACRRRAEHPDRADRRRRLRRAGHVRRRGPHADADEAGQRRPRYNAFHTTSICSPTAPRLADRAQHTSASAPAPSPSARWIGTATPASCRRGRDRRRGAEPLRLQDLRLRQMAQHARRPRRRRWGRRTAGRTATASTTSTASSPAKPRSGNRASWRTQHHRAAARREVSPHRGHGRTRRWPG
jgi:hypothetical protein